MSKVQSEIRTNSSANSSKFQNKRRKFIVNSAKVASIAMLALPLTLSAANKTNAKGAKMSVLNDFFTLNNGVKVPKLGLGLWRIDDDKVGAAIQAAVNVGYRHFDSAQAYANEAGTGEGVRNAIKKGLKREELFVTTKVAAQHKSYEAAKASIEESLTKLGLDYIDLMLIHAPQPWNNFRGGDYFEGNVAAWRALEEAYKAGKSAPSALATSCKRTCKTFSQIQASNLW